MKRTIAGSLVALLLAAACGAGTGAGPSDVDFSRNAHGPWDYLGGMLVCQEAGVQVADAEDSEFHDATSIA